MNMARKKQIPTACTSRDHKQRQMRAKNHESDGEGDKISNLPECLLSNVLSRLPTKDAVQTSVLSKKWEYKWTCIYNLEFNDRQHCVCSQAIRKEQFSDFVERVLKHGTGSLQSFILRCASTNYELSRIHAWISSALRRNVQILELDIWSASLVLPRCIYGCSFLRELRLLSQVTIRVPNETLFSKLEKLEFSHVILRNQDLNNDGQLLLKFPFLVSLSMYCCKWRNVKAVRLEAPLLTNFAMTYSSYQYGNEMEGFCFEICSPNLAEVKLNGEFSEYYVLPKPSTVGTAAIRLFFPSEWTQSGYRIARILRQTNALKYLELSSEVVIALNLGGQMGSLPLFENLIHLKLYTTYYPLMDGAAVVRLIQRTPVLQMLTMDMSTTAGNDLQHDDDEGDGIPACLSYHFKMAKFIYVYDSLKKEKDLGLMKFILKAARVLEQLEVVGPKKRTIPILSPEIQELLLTFPRASSVAQVVFSS